LAHRFRGFNSWFLGSIFFLACGKAEHRREYMVGQIFFLMAARKYSEKEQGTRVPIYL
jgi:hypothetical protein